MVEVFDRLVSPESLTKRSSNLISHFTAFFLLSTFSHFPPISVLSVIFHSLKSPLRMIMLILLPFDGSKRGTYSRTRPFAPFSCSIIFTPFIDQKTPREFEIIFIFSIVLVLVFIFFVWLEPGNLPLLKFVKSMWNPQIFFLIYLKSNQKYG